jgi:hypothetical protein
MSRPRKSSACVTLVLIGAAALTGCSDNASRRANYATREECLADWGDPRECEEQQATNSNGSRYRNWGHSGGYGGYGGFGGGSGNAGHSITHGGFGSHGSSSS